jgi:hypothetical protein
MVERRYCPVMTFLLGGRASPVGWSVQYLDAQVDEVRAAVEEARRGTPITVFPAKQYPDVLFDLPPFEAPWTRELLLECGDWTAYLNNFVNGGDSNAIGPAVARRMNIRCVVAEHTPRYGPGHAGTQLRVSGPAGEPPMFYERALSAVATDGRWQWYASGSPFPFEDLNRYTARRIRDRLDRELLVHYLQELGIDADRDTEYGLGVIVQQDVAWSRRTVSFEAARAELDPS